VLQGYIALISQNVDLIFLSGKAFFYTYSKKMKDKNLNNYPGKIFSLDISSRHNLSKKFRSIIL